MSIVHPHECSQLRTDESYCYVLGSGYKPLPYMTYNLTGSDMTLKGRKKKPNPMIHRTQLLLLGKKSEMNICMKAVFQDSPHFWSLITLKPWAAQYCRRPISWARGLPGTKEELHNVLLSTQGSTYMNNCSTERHQLWAVVSIWSSSVHHNRAKKLLKFSIWTWISYS